MLTPIIESGECDAQSLEPSQQDTSQNQIPLIQHKSLVGVYIGDLSYIDSRLVPVLETL